MQVLFAVHEARRAKNISLKKKRTYIRGFKKLAHNSVKRSFSLKNQWKLDSKKLFLRGNLLSYTHPAEWPLIVLRASTKAALQARRMKN